MTITQTDIDIPPRLRDNTWNSWPPKPCAPDGNQTDALATSDRHGPPAPLSAIGAPGRPTIDPDSPEYPAALAAYKVRNRAYEAIVHGDVSVLLSLFFQNRAAVSAEMLRVYGKWNRRQSEIDAAVTQGARKVAVDECDLILDRAPAGTADDFEDGSGDIIVSKNPVVQAADRVPHSVVKAALAAEYEER